MALSSRLQKFSEPETLRMAKMGRELRAKGFDVIDLSLGEPDFDTPQHIKEALKKAVDENWSHYPPVAGYPDLREAVCTKLKRDNDLEYKPENILVSTGAKQSIANLIMAVVDNGDEVIIPTPYWVSYSEIVRMCDGVPVMIRTKAEDGYKVKPEQVEAAITPKTKLFMFSSPCNPTGAVYSHDELEALANVFRNHPEIYIMSDEIYEYINYIGKHESIAQFEDLKDRVVIINGLSKGFAMTGYRLGYIAGAPDVVKACEKIQGQITSGANAATQKAAVIALTADLTPSREMVKEFEKRKKRIMEMLKELPGVTCNEPDGAFYVFPDISYYFGKSDGTTTIRNSDDLCFYILENAYVTTVTGKAFGEENCIRIAYTNSLPKIEEGMTRIKNVLAKLK
ncbi:pyridoxal phosphate-dependent aminotransferase [Flavihumibacter rivuli]|uniref:pyridoxal phosphate-dependent aminotransferase n=1 Tax=Flavihumibacter rivuli TaxID=2838156 RepID=UPI001BDE408A|nr:pyridoxal phosphate-dependent aminotransferase [Flavihumibacter rivuli]ULQ57965.1 pyridoxal phosphate-dependent aminotransferase [Flavihumibacter rivuli]